MAYDPTISSPTFGIGNVYLPSQYGGWEGSDSGGNVSPVQPVLYSSDKGTMPSDKHSFLSLTEWLQSQDISNLAAAGSGVLSEYPSYQLVTNTNGEAALQVDIPWGAYTTPLVNIRIPVEMADTFVERPQISDVAVDGYWQSNGEKTLLNIGAQATLEVDLTRNPPLPAAHSSPLTARIHGPKLPVTDHGNSGAGRNPNNQLHRRAGRRISTGRHRSEPHSHKHRQLRNVQRRPNGARHRLLHLRSNRRQQPNHNFLDPRAGQFYRAFANSG